MKVVLEPNNPMLAWRCEGLAERLKAGGFEVEIVRPEETRDVPSQVVGFVLGMVASGVFNHEVYPRLRQLVIEWFTEEPPKLKHPTRVQLFDQEGSVQEDFQLTD